MQELLTKYDNTIRWWNAHNSINKFLLKNLGQHPPDLDTSHQVSTFITEKKTKDW